MVSFKGKFTIYDGIASPAGLEIDFYNIKLLVDGAETVWKLDQVKWGNQNQQEGLLFSDGGFFTSDDAALKLTLQEYFPKSHFHPNPDKQFVSPPVVLFLGLILLAISAAIAIYVWGIPALGNFVGKRLPIPIEAKIGKAMKEQMQKDWKVDSARTKAINLFFSRINDNNEFKFEITVVNDKTVNAFALPGGNIVVYEGILQKIHSPEALASLLAHESSHIIFRHTSRMLCANLGNYIFLSAIIGDINGIAAILIQNADQIKGLSYNRDLETEADLKGLQLLQRRNLNPKGMLDLMQTLKGESEQSGNEVSEFVSTHPLPESRLKYVNDYLSKTTWSVNQDTVLTNIWSQIAYN